MRLAPCARTTVMARAAQHRSPERGRRYDCSPVLSSPAPERIALNRKRTTTAEEIA